MGINTVNLQNCLGQLSLLPVTGMDNEYSYGWVRAASDSSVVNSRQDYVRGINMPTYLLTYFACQLSADSTAATRLDSVAR